MCIDEILTEDNDHRILVAFLRKNAPTYPKYLKHTITKHNTECTYLSTMVRIFREGKWYRVHIVEATTTHLEWAINWMNNGAYKTMYLYQLGGLLDAELDEDQTPETERLLKDLQ